MEIRIMSLFKGWKPNQSSTVFIRFYLIDSQAFIGKKNNQLTIQGGDRHEQMMIKNILNRHEIELYGLSLTQLGNELSRRNLIAGSNRHNSPQDRYIPHRHSNDNVVSIFQNKSPTDLAHEANGLDLYTAPFKSSTLNNCMVTIDSREPASLLSLFNESKLPEHAITRATLPLGDIQIVDPRTGDMLLIERKTVSDFKQSVVTAHAHDQAERYYNEMHRMNSQGQRMKVIWIVESQDNGQKGLYDALPQVQNVDGMIAYLTGILNQSVIQSFNINHTVYIALKLAQCFIEQELFYKLKTNAPLANRKKKERTSLPTISNDAGNDHGVNRAVNDLASQLAYIPSLKKNVAVQLASTGRSYKQIINMTVEELQAIKGVGPKSAQDIYDDFNKV